jgi:hypothetical protein
MCEGDSVEGYCWLSGEVLAFLNIGIPEHFGPGPGSARARPTHEPYWTVMGRDLEARDFFWPEPDRNAVFSCFTL